MGSPAREQPLVLTWLGEGMTHLWHAGEVFVVSQSWNDATTSVGVSCGTLVDDGERELWVRIRNNAGQVGWSRFSM